MHLFDRIIAMPPAVITIAFVGALIAGSAALELSGAAWLIAYTVAMTVIFVPIMLWHYSLYRAASRRSADFVGHGGRRAFLFVICTAATLIFLATFIPSMTIAPTHALHPTIAALHAIALLCACVTYFAAIWAAANALTRLDEKRKSVEMHKTLGTFLLELYLPIGVWFIHSRIKRMLAAD